MSTLTTSSQNTTVLALVYRGKVFTLFLDSLVQGLLGLRRPWRMEFVAISHKCINQDLFHHSIVCHWNNFLTGSSWRVEREYVIAYCYTLKTSLFPLDCGKFSHTFFSLFSLVFFYFLHYDFFIMTPNDTS